MLPKTGYFGPQIFVEVLKVNSSLYEFSWHFRKCSGVPFNWLKPAAGLFCKYFKLSRDLFANPSFPLSPLSLAPCRELAKVLRTCNSPDLVP